MDKFLGSYLVCALWASTGDKDEPLDSLYSPDDFAPEALKQCRKDCKDFQQNNKKDLLGLDQEQCGQDFWLTRNHHGAGFWDRGLGVLGDRLTKAAQVYGSSYLYVGTDGKVHVE